VAELSASTVANNLNLEIVFVAEVRQSTATGMNLLEQECALGNVFRRVFWNQTSGLETFELGIDIVHFISDVIQLTGLAIWLGEEFEAMAGTRLFDKGDFGDVSFSRMSNDELLAKQITKGPDGLVHVRDNDGVMMKVHGVGDLPKLFCGNRICARWWLVSPLARQTA